MREGEGYRAMPDGGLAYVLGGIPVIEIPADGELNLLVEEFDAYREVVHAHGTEDVVERRRASVIGRGSTRGGRNALALHVLRLPVSLLNGDALRAVNEGIAGRGTGLVRELCQRPAPAV